MDPTTHDWSQAMAKKGGEGGCESTEITYDDKPFDLRINGLTKIEDPQSHNGAKKDEYESKWNSSDLLHTLHAFKYMKSVPIGRARK
jgi:hypothetical protein